MMNDKHPYCTHEGFPSDINELCNKCPIVDRIKEGINIKILKQAKDKKEILTDQLFNEYIEAEIRDASKAMEVVFLAEQEFKNQQNHRPERIQTYIWNKERIKALNSFLESENQNFEVIYDENGNKFTIDTIARYYAIAEKDVLDVKTANKEILQYGHLSGKCFKKAVGDFRTSEGRQMPKTEGEKSKLAIEKSFTNLIKLCEILNDEKSKRIASQELIEFREKYF